MTALQSIARLKSIGQVILPVPETRVAAGQPLAVTVAAVSGSKVDLPDDEWFSAFARTEGSIQDPSFHRPEQPVIDPAPELD